MGMLSEYSKHDNSYRDSSVNTIFYGDWLYLLLSTGTLAASWLIYRWTLSPVGDGPCTQEPEILARVANIPD